MMPAPAEVVALQAQFGHTVALIRQLRAALEDLRAASPAPQPTWNPIAVDAIQTEARRFAAQVVDVATAQLGDAFARPKIDAEQAILMLAPPAPARRRGEDWEQARATAEEHWARFDVLAFWDALAASYPREGLIAQAARLAARDIATLCDLDPNTPLRIVSGRVELSARVWLDSVSCGQCRLSYNASERMARLAAALRTFAHQALADTEAQAVADLAQALTTHGSYHRTFEARQRTTLPGGTMLVTFQSAFKLYLPQPIAMALNVYLAQHAPERFDTAA